MGVHLVAFSGAKTDSTANEAAPAIADLTLTRTANLNTYLMPWDATVLGAIVYNDTVTRARLNAPSLRDLSLPEIFPLNALAEPSAAFGMALWGMNGPRLRRGDEFGVDSSNGASTVDLVHVGLWLADRIDPIPAGRRFTVRGTATQVLVASAWSNAPIVLSDILGPGRYGVIGMQVTCNDGVLARLAFPGDNRYRPGVPTGETIALYEPRQPFRAGAFGLLGTFDQNAPPQLEVLGGTAGAETPAVILDLVHLG